MMSSRDEWMGRHTAPARINPNNKGGHMNNRMLRLAAALAAIVALSLLLEGGSALAGGV